MDLPISLPIGRLTVKHWDILNDLSKRLVDWLADQISDSLCVRLANWVAGLKTTVGLVADWIACSRRSVSKTMCHVKLAW